MIGKRAAAIGLTIAVVGLLLAVSGLGRDNVGDTSPVPAGGSCTNILVGREASVDGSTIASYSDDISIHFSFVGVTPRWEFPPGTSVPIYHADAPGQVKPFGEIP